MKSILYKVVGDVLKSKFFVCFIGTHVINVLSIAGTDDSDSPPVPFYPKKEGRRVTQVSVKPTSPVRGHDPNIVNVYINKFIKDGISSRV